MRYALAPALLALCAQLAAADPAAEALDKAVGELPKSAGHDHGHGHAHRTPSGAPELRLVDLSLAVLGAAGVSTATDHDLEMLKLGGHDPNRRGFTLQAAELSITGAVDPYFTAEAHIVAAPEHGVELEEAFITTTGLPHGLEAKAGYQLIEFGRINHTHSHAWSWLDQPVIASRLLGGEGSRSTGLRVAWLAPTAWYSQVSVGAFNADDESLASFRGEAGGHHHDEEEEGPERTIGGRLRAEELETRSTRELVWFARWENSADLGGAEAKLGLSWLGGPNAAAIDTRSDLYGADLVVGMRPAHGPFSSVKFTAEAMLRRAEVPAGEDPGEDGDITTGADNFLVPDATLTDWGLYAQLELGLGEHWLVGLRGEYADASGDSATEDGLVDNRDDLLRDRRTRVSPLLAWRPSEFSRLRLQYDYDRSTAYEDDEAHSVWLGLDVLIGAHPPHGF